jgi:hypothetical protein
MTVLVGLIQAYLIWCLIVYLYGVLLVAFFTSWLATEKRRDPVLWFFLGALFGWIALITLGLAPAGHVGSEVGEGADVG